MLRLFVFMAFLMLSMLPVEAIAELFETPHNRKASEILSPAMISGPHYRIREKVVSYGYMHHYTVETSYGVFNVTGDMALRKLLKEIQAIAALKKITESKAFIDAVKASGKKPLDFGENLITEPVDTLTGIPKGVSRLFGNIATSITKTHDPSEDERYKQALLVSNYKREYAYKLGVDVYSSNQALQKELNKVGWASAIGSLSLSAVTAGAGSTTVSVVSSMRLAKSINEVLMPEPPARLRVVNEERLSGMGVSIALREQFLDHPHFTPRHDTIIVECLRNLPNALGRDAFIKYILQADDETSANFFQQMAETMVGYQDKVSPIMEIRVIDGVALARAKNESVLIPFPLDHGVWTENAAIILENFAKRYMALKLKGKLELWVTGTLSPMAQQEIEKLGIVVTQNVDQKIGFMD